MNAPFQETRLIDDFSYRQQASIGQCWQYVSDTVMGGISQGFARHESVNGRHALLLAGNVSLENNGGFIQAALDLEVAGKLLDASAAEGIAVSICGDGRSYALNLRTADTERPWQSYRCTIDTESHWQTRYLPFASFIPHRIEQALNPQILRRIGLIAIGSPGPARVAISRIALYGQGKS
ncbi:CIA30 family protein [Congregibacter brevis]|uniref:CIA30 family protein n=1 Tax=Congregibacter brevis TaxID=3081201 RepID=A0ABZ0IAT3_9GAMM|nr:CIA30 family protein [Congregibacter sp. IMCC45268]